MALMLLTGLGILCSCGKEGIVKQRLVGSWAQFDNHLTVYATDHFEVNVYLEFTRQGKLITRSLSGETADYDEGVLSTPSSAQWKEEEGSPVSYKVKGNTLILGSGQEYTVEAVEENDNIVVKFGDSWYRTLDDFFTKAKIGSSLLTTVYDQLEDFEVI